MPIPQGFRLTGVHCGIKTNPAAEDLTLTVCDVPATAAGVYTQNRVFAAPVAWDRERTPTGNIRAVVVNAGNANACTGERGMADARRMAQLTAGVCDAQEDQVLVMSTGIIGEYLPMDKIATGIEAAATQLATDEAGLQAAARAIMTTDTCAKTAGRSLTLDGRTIRITGITKGSGMIGPKMATMLGLILTDAPLEPAIAQSALAASVDVSFNCTSVDGHMSTNDTVLLLASGAAGGKPLSGDHLAAFNEALEEVSIELARSIAADGEGATHLMTIDISGCTDQVAARQIAKTVAESPLVKTAVAGADPNWGRIVSAAGYAGVAFDPAKVCLRVNGFPLYRNGAPVEFDQKVVSDSIRQNRDTLLELKFGEGDARGRFWTSDLTAEYVRINADYHT